MKKAAAIGFAALMAVSCASGLSAPGAAAGVPVRLDVTAVPLDPLEPARRNIGSFVYAGGIEIKSEGPSAVAELSDLRIVASDRLVAVSDQGYFFEGRLLFDGMDRLSGLTDARVTPLVDEQGERLASADADAEGLELLANGDRLVTFEGPDRIWLYPAGGSLPRPLPKPDAVFPANEGMEAITLFPAGGNGAYLVGSEGGDSWLCGPATCAATALGAVVPSGFGLTAMAAYGDDGALAMLGRSYDPARGVRISVRLMDTAGAAPARVVDEMTIAPPLTVDNFEGIAVVPRTAGGIRLYLASDDNASATQRTYLLAFDWQPPR